MLAGLLDFCVRIGTMAVCGFTTRVSNTAVVIQVHLAAPHSRLAHSVVDPESL